MLPKGPRLTMLAIILLSGSLAHAAPSDVIEMFNVSYSADTYVWTIDRSGSTGSGALQAMKDAVTAAIDQLCPEDEFSVSSYGVSAIFWSLEPVPATQDNKDAAIAWVNALNSGSWTCMLDALLGCLDIAEQGSGDDAVIFLLGDGFPICAGMDESPQVLSDFTAANTNGVSLHTILVSPLSSAGEPFFEELAALNDGIYNNAFGPLPPQFRRGDVDGNGDVDGLVDALFLLSYQFITGSPVPPCLDAADIDDDGVVSGIIDGVALLSYQFSGGAAPAFPGPTTCSNDPNGDEVTCEVEPTCP